MSTPKFKVLLYNKTLMSYIGINSERLTEPSNEFFRSVGTYYVLFCALFLDVISIGLYILENVSQFSQIFQTFIVFIGGIQHGGMILSIGLNLKKVKLLHLTLQGIVDEGNEMMIING